MRILVVYGSSRGGTAGLAHMIAEAFVEHGILADIGNAADVDDLAMYDAVVLGGALYNGRWHPDASGFVERNLEALRAAPAWFFSSGPLDGSARNGSLAPVEQVRELARQADIRGHMTFGGVLEKRRSRLFPSLLAWGKAGDFRDRQQVEEWVERIIARLRDKPPPLVRRDVASPDGSWAEVDDDLGLDVLIDETM